MTETTDSRRPERNSRGDVLKPAIFPSDKSLIGRLVRLEPLSLEHVSELWEAGRYPQIWEWSPWPITNNSEMHAYVEDALEDLEAGNSMPYATIDQDTDRAIGASRFMNVVPLHRRVEIGHTWLTPSAQRTGRNREAKLLMLEEAFDRLGYERVELKTDALNTQSRTAIARLGAVEEGTLRNHVVTRSGRRRDTTYYSILVSEWPAIKKKLEKSRGTSSTP